MPTKAVEGDLITILNSGGQHLAKIGAVARITMNGSNTVMGETLDPSDMEDSFFQRNFSITRYFPESSYELYIEPPLPVADYTVKELLCQSKL